MHLSSNSLGLVYLHCHTVVIGSLVWLSITPDPSFHVGELPDLSLIPALVDSLQGACIALGESTQD